MKKTSLFTMLAALAGMFVFAKCNHADNSGDQMKLLKMIEFRRSLDIPINYYGRVVDQQGNPIPNVIVVVQVGRASGIKILDVPTDTDGRFEISGIDGSDLLITEIKAQGYEYLVSNRANGHSGYENDGSKVIDKNIPVVFTLRKKEPTTVVIPGDISVVYAKGVKFYEVDLIEMVDEKAYGLRRYHGDNAHADIKTRVEYSTVDDSYTFILEAPDSDSGIIALDQMLYALPPKGYISPFKIKVPNGQSVSTYLYVKSRNGLLYSRLDVKFAIGKEKVYFTAKAWTNPLGERNVDFDGEKYKEYIRKTDAEAKRMGPKP